MTFADEKRKLALIEFMLMTGCPMPEGALPATMRPPAGKSAYQQAEAALNAMGFVEVALLETEMRRHARPGFTSDYDPYA